MSGITNPAEEYFKDGGWAWDPAGSEWLKLVIDPLTNRLVIDHPGDLEVVQPVPNDLRVGNYGWDGAAWHKTPMLWGYSEVYSEREVADNVAAGNVIMTFSTVPEGEIWVITHFSGYSFQANATAATFQAVTSLAPLHLKRTGAIVVNESIEAQCPFVLVKDEYLLISWTAAAAGDDFRGYAMGYKMKVAE